MLHVDSAISKAARTSPWIPGESYLRAIATGAGAAENGCMFKRRFILSFAIGCLGSLWSVSLYAIPATLSQGLCYGGCGKAIGAARCSKASELLKDDDGSWATSWHKRSLAPEIEPLLAPEPAKPAFHTSRRYRYLYAENQAEPKQEAAHSGAL
jgi:hypothetical protein